MYVDDLMSGADYVRSAIGLQQQAACSFENGRPTKTNCLSGRLNHNENATFKTLGVTWVPATDRFGFRVTFPINTSSAKNHKTTTITVRCPQTIRFIGSAIAYDNHTKNPVSTAVDAQN